MPGPVRVRYGKCLWIDYFLWTGFCNQPSFGMSFNHSSGLAVYHVLLLPWSSDYVSSPATISFIFMSEDTRPVPLKVVGAKICILNMQRNIHLVNP